MEIKNRILRSGLVRWRKLRWLQPPGLKEITPEAFEKLKRSLVNNNFVDPFKIWKEKRQAWILDGYHRKRAMKELEEEGVKIPELLPANFIDCKDRKQAAKLVLVYTSMYARATQIGVDEFAGLEEIDLGDLDKEIDIPGVDLFEGVSEEMERDIPEKKEIIRPYKKTHILLSFPPGVLVKMKPYIKEILAIEGVEYEQSSN
jgi:hypothetical protein